MVVGWKHIKMLNKLMTHRIFPLVLVLLGHWVLVGLGPQPRGQLGHGEPRIAAHDELLQGVVDEFVLLLCVKIKLSNCLCVLCASFTIVSTNPFLDCLSFLR